MRKRIWKEIKSINGSMLRIEERLNDIQDEKCNIAFSMVRLRALLRDEGGVGEGGTDDTPDDETRQREEERLARQARSVE